MSRKFFSILPMAASCVITQAQPVVDSDLGLLVPGTYPLNLSASAVGSQFGSYAILDSDGEPQFLREPGLVTIDTITSSTSDQLYRFEVSEPSVAILTTGNGNRVFFLDSLEFTPNFELYSGVPATLLTGVVDGEVRNATTVVGGQSNYVLEPGRPYYVVVEALIFLPGFNVGTLSITPVERLIDAESPTWSLTWGHDVQAAGDVRGPIDVQQSGEETSDTISDWGLDGQRQRDAKSVIQLGNIFTSATARFTPSFNDLLLGGTPGRSFETAMSVILGGFAANAAFGSEQYDGSAQFSLDQVVAYRSWMQDSSSLGGQALNVSSSVADLPGVTVDGVISIDGPLDASGNPVFVNLLTTAGQSLASPGFQVTGLSTGDQQVELETAPPGRYRVRASFDAFVDLDIGSDGSTQFPGRSISTSNRLLVSVEASGRGEPIAPPPCDGTGWCGDVDLDGELDLDDLDAWDTAPVDTTGDGSIDSRDRRFLEAQLIGLGLIGACRADVNGDGEINVADIVTFIDGIEEAHPSADIDGVAGADFFDVIALLDLIASGCE